MPDVQHLIGKKLEVDLAGEITTLEVVDWADLEQVSDELAEKASGLSQEEINKLYNSSWDPVTEIYEYFLGDHDDAVSAGRWLPFGLLGVGHQPDSFAELNNDGLLAFDLERADGDRAPILWIRDGEVTEIATHIDDLKISSIS